MQPAGSFERLLKFAYQPAGAWREQHVYLENHSFGVAAVQGVDEKMSDGQVERAWGQCLAHRVNVVKFHSGEFSRRYPLASHLDHSGTGFDHGDAGVLIAS